MAGRDLDRSRAGEGPLLGLLSVSDAARLRRRWPIPIVAAVVVGVVLYLAAMLGSAQYSAQAALQLLNRENTPSQETALADGYVDFFNLPATQAALRQQTGTDASLALTSWVASSGPILYVSATGSDSQAVQDAANKNAAAFSDMVNQRVTASTTASEAALKGSSPSTLDVMQEASGATKLTQSKAKSIAPWVGLTAIVVGVAVMISPGRRRDDRGQAPERAPQESGSSARA